mmetsp:Transcript_146606/g.365583  ORF Transcript_146606/g.365583 Transcript_146606/m.365583 type:complete len:242 (+) Transcript_146606:842-1567(+)
MVDGHVRLDPAETAAPAHDLPGDAALGRQAFPRAAMVGRRWASSSTTGEDRIRFRLHSWCGAAFGTASFFAPRAPRRRDHRRVTRDVLHGECSGERAIGDAELVGAREQELDVKAEYGLEGLVPVLRYEVVPRSNSATFLLQLPQAVLDGANRLASEVAGFSLFPLPLRLRLSRDLQLRLHLQRRPAGGSARCLNLHGRRGCRCPGWSHGPLQKLFLHPLWHQKGRPMRRNHTGGVARGHR